MCVFQRRGLEEEVEEEVEVEEEEEVEEEVEGEEEVEEGEEGGRGGEEEVEEAGRGSPVPPYLSAMLMSMPEVKDSMVRMTSSLPLPAAHMKAVRPSRSGSSFTEGCDRNTPTVSFGPATTHTHTHTHTHTQYTHNT